MAFTIPGALEDLYDETVSRFKLLLQKQVLTGVEVTTLNQWLANFTTNEERYLAAHLLNSVIYRSNAMVCSSLQHLIHTELPAWLKSEGLAIPQGLTAFRAGFRNATVESPYRFVAVDGAFEEVPGKSGGVMIRIFKQNFVVSKSLLCRPERIQELPDHVRYLVFIDDLVGSGKQFIRFANFYTLPALIDRFKMLFSPMICYQSGLDKITKEFPWLAVKPIEVLCNEHKFFRGDPADERIWHADKVNRVLDVKHFYSELVARNQVTGREGFNLDLTVAFEHGTPNNTLAVFWATTPTWQRLFLK